jgi:hypothetical protein
MQPDVMTELADLATRTGWPVTLTAAPYREVPGVVQWTVLAHCRGALCTGSSTRIEDAVGECCAAVDLALGRTEYPQGKEG